MYQRHFTGKLGEQKAVTHLKKLGYTILDRNYHTRWGEIDIVAKKDSTVYFFEVKTRHSVYHGHPFETISHRKLKTIKQTAFAYLAVKPQEFTKLSVGVVGVLMNRKTNNTQYFMIEDVGWI